MKASSDFFKTHCGHAYGTLSNILCWYAYLKWALLSKNNGFKSFMKLHLLSILQQFHRAVHGCHLVEKTHEFTTVKKKYDATLQKYWQLIWRQICRKGIFAVQTFIYLLVPWFTFLKTNVALNIQHSDW